MANLAALPPYPDRFFAAAQYAAVPGTVDIDNYAAHAVKSFSDLTNLLLYSLYQQASYGPCTTPKPWFLNVVESAKWASWKQLGDMAPVEAMRLFVRTLEEEIPDWWQLAQVSLTSNPGDHELPPTLNGGAFDEQYDEEFSLATELRFLPDNQWEVLSVKGRKPTARYQHGAVLIGQRMVVVGGNCYGKHLNDIQVLDLKTLLWSKVEAPPSPANLPPCAGHCLVRRDVRTLLAIGGHSKDGQERVVVRALDMGTNRWTVVKCNGKPPVSRGGHSVSRVGATLWMFGGEDSKRRLFNDVHTLDLETMQWQAVETSGAAPSARCGHVATIHGGRYLAVFGGGSHSACFNDLHVLDLDTLIWSKPIAGGSIPSGRSGHAGVVIGSSWYITGGGDNQGGNPETLVMDLDSFTWSVVATAPPRTSIASEGLSLVLKGKLGSEETVLIAFGGYNGKYSNEVYAFRPGFAGENKPKAPSSAVSARTESSKRKGEEADAPPPVYADEAARREAELRAEEAELAARQLEEAENAAARAEKVAFEARADAEFVAAKARADAWAVIGKAKQEEEAMREQVANAQRGKEQAEAQAEEARGALVTAQLALASAQAEAVRLRQELHAAQASLAEAFLKSHKAEDGVELARLQKDFNAAKNSLADAEQELQSVRGSLASEQARCFGLEVEVAELRQRLAGMEGLERELELLRRQKAAADEAAAAVSEAAERKSHVGPGVWGWLAPTGGPPAAR